MKPLPLPHHHPAPAFQAVGSNGLSVSLRDYRFRRDLLLVMLHGPSCEHCVRIAEALESHRNDWEQWETALLVLETESDPLFPPSTRLGIDPSGEIKLRYGGSEADAVLAVIDHRGRLMEGWSLVHPEPVDWREMAETVRWVALQEPECGACEVLPGWG